MTDGTPDPDTTLGHPQGDRDIQPDDAGHIDGFIEALLALSAGHDLDTTLRTILTSAISLADAKYGALGILGEDEELERFLYQGIDYQGIDEVTRARIGHLRLDELSPHEASAGFPEHHPPIHTFLGVPVQIKGTVFGTLYLTEKSHGRAFTAQDERIVRAFASAAAIAIDNAQATIKQEWQSATSEVVTALLAGAEPLAVLQLITNRSVSITHSDCAYLAVPADPEPTDNDPADLVITAASGSGSDILVGRGIPVNRSTSGQAYRLKKPITTRNLLFDPGFEHEHGPAIALPLRDGQQVIGVLTVLRGQGSQGYRSDEVSMMSAFADHGAIALRLAGNQRRLRELDILSERDRIARDLHDQVIQRVFAVGLSVQGTLQRTRSAEVQRRLTTTIDDLQDIIEDIRRTIFDLHTSDNEAPTLCNRLHSVIAEVTAETDLTVTLHVKGPLSVVDRQLGDHLEAVLRESLSNVVKHADASSVTITVDVQDELTISIADDGVGIAPGVHRRGLSNLADRAAELDGTFDVRTASGSGTTLVWSVPLPDQDE